jgi:hypothetical protein
MCVVSKFLSVPIVLHILSFSLEAHRLIWLFLMLRGFLYPVNKLLLLLLKSFSLLCTQSVNWRIANLSAMRSRICPRLLIGFNQKSKRYITVTYWRKTLCWLSRAQKLCSITTRWAALVSWLEACWTSFLRPLHLWNLPAPGSLLRGPILHVSFASGYTTSSPIQSHC